MVSAEKLGVAIIVMDTNLQSIELTKYVSTHIANIKIGHGRRSLILVLAYFK